MNKVYITIGPWGGISISDSPLSDQKYVPYDGLSHQSCTFFIAGINKKIRLNKQRRADIAAGVMFHLQDRKIRVSMLWAVQ